LTFAGQLKSDLAASRPLRVVNIDYSNAGLVEFLGKTCADVIFIDCEQGDTSVESIENLARAAHVAGVPAIVRTGSPDAAVIERTLLRGVDGIVLPRLKTSAEARKAVAAVHYCMSGQRPDFAVIVQVEDIAAVQTLDEFLSVEGIDCFFVGPVDLSKSMGFGGTWTRTEVRDVVEQTLSRIIAAGRAAGMLASPDTIGELHRLGVSFLYLHTNDFIRLGTDEIAARCMQID